MAISYSLRMCARHVDSTNSGPSRSNLVFRSKPIPEAEMSNRLIYSHCYNVENWRICCPPSGVLYAGLFCDGMRRYGAPGNENDESRPIVFMSVGLLYWYDK